MNVIELKLKVMMCVVFQAATSTGSVTRSEDCDFTAGEHNMSVLNCETRNVLCIR